MKVIKLDDNNSLKEALRIKKRRLREEDAGMNKFHMVYTVDGVKSEQDISAANIMKAEELIRKQYDGKNIIFTSKQPVKENLEEDKIADKIKSKQDPKEMTKKAIRMLKNLGGNYEDLAKEFKDAYGEDPLEESVENSDLHFVKRAFSYDIYKYGNNYVLLDGEADIVYTSDNTLDCLKWAKKNSSKAWNFNNVWDWDRLKESVKLDSWNNDFLHEDIESPEKVLEADEKVPQTEETVGLSNMIIKEINGEWETISNYNDLISLMRAEGQDDMINVISDIIDEENKHVGQLQKCLQLISPNVSEIDSGETEAIGQLDTNDNLYADDSCVDCVDDDFGPNSGFDIYLV